nr:hypothetical protein [Tanacetum cinerariifolium]
MLSNEMNDLNDIDEVERGNGLEDSNGAEVKGNYENNSGVRTEESVLESQEELTCENEVVMNCNGKERLDTRNGKTDSGKGNHEQRENNNWNNQDTNSSNGKTYAKMVTKGIQITSNKLDYIPSELNKDGSEIAVFDEAMVDKGSAQWKLTICRNFVGYKMSVHELTYHVRRMWSKWGVDDIDMKANGPVIGMEKVKQTKVPMWVSLVNVPLEALSKEVISALASSLGKLVIMDAMTAKRCILGEGWVDFARILVEFDVKIRFKENIEYKDKDNTKKDSKHVKVEGYKGEPWKRKEIEDGKYDKAKSKKQVKEGKNTKEGKEIVRGRMIVDGFINKKMQPNIIEAKNWTKDMLTYIKEQWEVGNKKEKREESEDIKDLLEINAGPAKDLNTKEIKGLFYTWITSPSKHNTSILKKLDRTMVNADFINKYGDAYARFHPFLTSDNSHVVLHIPNTLDKKKKSFKFLNFVTDKDDFLKVVRNDRDVIVKAFLRNNSETKEIESLDELFSNKLTKEENKVMVRDIIGFLLMSNLCDAKNDRLDLYKGLCFIPSDAFISMSLFLICDGDR